MASYGKVAIRLRRPLRALAPPLARGLAGLSVVPIEVNTEASRLYPNLIRRKLFLNPYPFNEKRLDYPVWEGKIKMKLRLN